MALFADVLFRGFNNAGYNVLRRPMGSLLTLDLLGRDDVLERIGPLPNLLTLRFPVPPWEGPAPAANFAGQISSQMHISTGLQFLRQWLRAIGGTESIGDLAPAFSSARFLEFVLDAPEVIRTDPFALERAIRATAAIPGSAAERWVGDRNTDLFVVTDVVQMNSLGVRAYDVGSSLVSMDVPALARAAGGSVSVKVSVSSGGPSSWITCEGRYQMTCAFKCVRVRRSQSGQLSVDLDMANRPNRESGVLFAPGTLVTIN